MSVRTEVGGRKDKKENEERENGRYNNRNRRMWKPFCRQSLSGLKGHEWESGNARKGHSSISCTTFLHREWKTKC